jgi:hypothetical protein
MPFKTIYCLPTLDHFLDKISSKLDSSGQEIAKFNQQTNHCRVSPAKKKGLNLATKEGKK